MENNKTGKELLTAFAESRLNEHQQELQTNYQERGLSDESEKAKAYKEHAKLFKSELVNKLLELKENYNKEAGEMEAVIKQFSEKLSNHS